MDKELGTVAQLLHDQGELDAAALLAEAIDVQFEWQRNDWGINHYGVTLLVPYYAVRRSNDDLLQAVVEAWNIVSKGILDADDRENRGQAISSVQFAPALLDDPNWRASINATLAGKPINQAALGSPASVFPSEDRMRFRDGAELTMYRALKEIVVGFPADRQAMIVPNAAARVSGNTREPDFIIGYLGRIGVVQVDGSTHHKRWAADRSQDRMYEDAGVALVDHIAAEEASDLASAKKFAERFLARLAGGT